MKSRRIVKLNVPAPPVMQRISKPISLIVLFVRPLSFVSGKFVAKYWLRLLVLARLFWPVSVVPLGVDATHCLSWKLELGQALTSPRPAAPHPPAASRPP